MINIKNESLRLIRTGNFSLYNLYVKTSTKSFNEQVVRSTAKTKSFYLGNNSAMAACLQYLLVSTQETVRKRKNAKFLRKKNLRYFHGYKSDLFKGEMRKRTFILQQRRSVRR